MPSPVNVNQGGLTRRRPLKGSDLALIPRSTPPLNPQAGDLWVYPAGSNGEMWMFVYDTTDTSGHRWKFIGGAPVLVHYDYSGGQSIGNSTFTNVTNLSLTTARAGDYIFDANVQIASGAAGTWEYILALSHNNAVAVYNGNAYFGYPIFSDSVAGAEGLVTGRLKVTGAAAGDTWQAIAWCNSTGTNSIPMGRFSVIPVRVS